MQVKALVKRLIRDIRGASAVEYGLLVALIALALVAGLNTLQGPVLASWNDVAEKTPG